MNRISIRQIRINLQHREIQFIRSMRKYNKQKKKMDNSRKEHWTSHWDALLPRQLLWQLAVAAWVYWWINACQENKMHEALHSHLKSTRSYETCNLNRPKSSQPFEMPRKHESNLKTEHDTGRCSFHLSFDGSWSIGCIRVLDQYLVREAEAPSFQLKTTR